MELVTRRKNDLEKKVEQLIFERDQLNAVLDESSDKILMLEKQTREQDCQVMVCLLSVSALQIDDLFTISIDFDHFRSISITSDPNFKTGSRSDLRSQI